MRQNRDIRSLHLAVVGLGALGNEVIKTLGLLAPASVLCIDPDIVERSNIERSIFYERQSVGNPKAQVMVSAARRRFPDTTWEGLSAEIADTGWGTLKDLDLIMGCVDRDSARLEMARISTRLGVPVCDAGLSVALARVSYFPGRGAACFGCRLSSSRRREILAEWRSDAHPCGALPREIPGNNSPATAALGGALAVELGLRALAEGQAETITTEARLDGTPQITTVRVPQSESCPFHERSGAPLVPIAGTLAEMVRGGRTVGWEWPVCTRARCLSCGREWQPMVRKARVKACPHCAAASVLTLECVSRIREGSPWVDRRPEEIGLPARHLYTVWEVK